MTTFKEYLLDRIQRDKQTLGILEDAERNAALTKLVGRCYKYRNCYSCPRSLADYWWLYGVVQRAPDGGFRMFQFSVDKDGKVEVERRTLFGIPSEGYRPITRREFDKAWKALLRRLSKETPHD